jgi:twitching motility protein PilT
VRKTEFDIIVRAMLDSHPGISDLLFCVERPFQVESFGVLRTVEMLQPHVVQLTPWQVEQVAVTIIGSDRRLITDLLQHGSCDCGYSLGEHARFRVNIFRQRGRLGIIMRKLQSEIPTLDSLGLPPIFLEIARERTGLVLVTGATGSGKTTTLAAVLNAINEEQAVHVVTLEDPIEYVHPHRRATFNQRELGADFDTYPHGLRAALRQAPKVILVGEMRDRDTVEIALTAAETGHLVLSTIHTIDAGQSINRILGMFDQAEETQVRIRLAETLRYVVSQRLAPKLEGGRQLLLEIMGSNLRTREAIALGEAEGRTFNEIIEASETFGWLTFERSIAEAYEREAISEETAVSYATRKGKLTRLVDVIKKRRGVFETSSGLRLDTLRPAGSGGGAK